jgi:hypothetical protein
VTYTFHNTSDGSKNWDNFIVEIRTAEDVGVNTNNTPNDTTDDFDAPVYIDARSDNYGWTANAVGAATLVWAELPDGYSWDDYAATMQSGVDCTVNIVRSGNTFTISMQEGDDYTFTATATVADFEGQDAIVYLTGEKVELTKVKFVNNTNVTDDATGDATEGTTEEDVTNPSTDTTNPSVDTTNPSVDTTNPSVDTTNPSVDTTNPSVDTTNPSVDTTNPSVDTGAIDVSSTLVSEEEAKAVEAAAELEYDATAGLPEGVKLAVNAISESDSVYDAISNFITNKLKNGDVAVVDLSLVDANGATIETQPTGKVKVTLPIFENIKDAKNVAVYRYDDTKDKFVAVDIVKVNDGKFTFETDHFTPYVFESMDTVLYGDVDRSGDVSLLDSAIIKRYLAGWDVEIVNEIIADVDASGEVELYDSALIKRNLAGWDVTLRTE